MSLTAPVWAINFTSIRQVSDTLYMGKDTLLAIDNLLSKVCYEGASDDLLFDSVATCRPSDCQRGYRSQWMVADSSLYLTQVHSCCFAQDSLEADLQKVFPDQYADGRVFARWATDTYRFNKGKMLLTNSDRNEALYEKEVELTIREGRLEQIQEFDNSKTRLSVYAQNKDSLYSFIYPRIDWDKAGDGFLIALVSANEEGQIDSVQIVKTLNPDTDRQVAELLRQVPSWDVLYKRGEFMRQTQVLKIFFNGQKRRQWAK